MKMGSRVGTWTATQRSFELYLYEGHLKAGESGAAPARARRSASARG